MYYEINVSVRKDENCYHQHLFATAPRSITSQAQLEAIIKLFEKKFPKSEGYKITATRWEELGTTVYER